MHAHFQDKYLTYSKQNRSKRCEYLSVWKFLEKQQQQKINDNEWGLKHIKISIIDLFIKMGGINFI